MIVIVDNNIFMMFSTCEPIAEEGFFSENCHILAPRDVLLDEDFVSQILRLRGKNMEFFFVVVGRGSIISLSVFWCKFVRGINVSNTYF